MSIKALFITYFTKLTNPITKCCYFILLIYHIAKPFQLILSVNFSEILAFILF